MFKTQINRLFIVGISILLISCNGSNTQELEQTVNEVKDGQQVILKKLATMEKAIANISSAKFFRLEFESIKFFNIFFAD